MKTLLAATLGMTLVTCMSAAFGAGDANLGKDLYDSRCTGCHSVDRNRIGPAHQGVVGRKAGLAPGYDYSPAVKASKLAWSDKSLDAWLKSPERLIPGQKMGYSVSAAKDRDDLIAYLKTLKGQP